MLGGDQKSKLEKKYKKLMEEAFQLSKTNRSKSDQKMAEAEAIRKQIDQLNGAS